MISAAINSNSKVSYFKITRKNGIIKKEPITPWYAKNKNTEDSFIKTEEFNNLNTAKINDAPVKSLKYFFSSSHNFKLFDNCIKQNASTLTKTKFILIYLHVMLVDKKISAININQKHTAEILTNYTKTIKTNKKLEITESTYSRTQTSWNENYPFTDISDQHHKKFTEVEFITRLYTKNKT
ncbi:MAG: hypothetical protein COB98_01575 [Flavobacteriaceae bacterium]|nr:MAG: hypothetical protein COB98_01575 [Flavobacteriaceae bacterium]